MRPLQDLEDEHEDSQKVNNFWKSTRQGCSVASIESFQVSPVWTPSLVEREQDNREEQRKHDQALREHVTTLKSRLSTDQDLKKSIGALWGVKVTRKDETGQDYTRLHYTSY